VAGAGAGLVAASPAGPVQAVPDPVGVGWLGLQDDDEAADLVCGETQGRTGPVGSVSSPCVVGVLRRLLTEVLRGEGALVAQGRRVLDG
jgi:hypothetical protein